MKQTDGDGDPKRVPVMVPDYGRATEVGTARGKLVVDVRKRRVDHE